LKTQAALNISKGKTILKILYANNTENVTCQKQLVVYAHIVTLIYNQM